MSDTRTADAPVIDAPVPPTRLHHPQLRTLADTLALHADRIPDRAAVLCEGRELTYAGLSAAATRVAAALAGDGVGRGSRVAYLATESEDYYELLFGCALSGAVLVPINWRLTAVEIEHILRDSGSELLLVGDRHTTTTSGLVADLPTLRRVVHLGEDYQVWKAAAPQVSPQAPGGPDDAVVQMYTSGTTGLPKGVVLAQRSFFAIGRALAAADLGWIDWQEGDRSLIGIPGLHVGGIWWAMQGFNAGVTNVVMRAFDSRTAARLIDELQVTTVCVVPSMLRMLLVEPGVDAHTYRSVRKVVYGGSPISETLLTESLAIFDCEFAQIYGLTETGNTAICLPPADHVPGSPRLRAAGTPYPGVRVRIVDGTGVEQPTGSVGEVCLHTPAVMLGYWGMPDATAATLVDGWLHTGDAGHVDGDGYLYISDRIKDMIIVGGEKIYPTEIENVLSGHPAVGEVAVIGVPDERFGEAVHAFVVLRAGAEAEPRDLAAFLRGTVADFKMPSRFHFLEEVPRNPSGKILRRELRDSFWRGHDRNVN